MKDEEWKKIRYRIEKRKFNGKDSDVYFHCRLIPQKRVKKEVSRRFFSAYQNAIHLGNIYAAAFHDDYLNNLCSLYFKGRSPSPVNDISILTPKLAHNPFSSEPGSQVHINGMARSRKSPENNYGMNDWAMDNNFLPTSPTLHDFNTASNETYGPLTFKQPKSPYSGIIHFPKDSGRGLQISQTSTSLENEQVSVPPTSIRNGRICTRNFPWFEVQKQVVPKRGPAVWSPLKPYDSENKEQSAFTDLFSLMKEPNSIERIS